MTDAAASRFRRVAGHFGRLALGAILLAAAILKALDPEEFARQMAGYELVPAGLAAVAAPLLIALEATLGMALLAGLRPRPALAAGAALLVLFIAVEAWGLLRGRTEACGCFGAYVQRTPGQVIAEDLLFLGFAGLGAWGLRGWAGGRRRAAVAVLATAALSLAFALASPRLPIDRFVTRLAEGRSLADLGLEAAAPDLGEGRHLVALLDLPDPRAAEAADRLNAVVEAGGTTPVVALTASSDEEQAAFLWSAAPAFPVRHVDRAILKPLYRRLPLYFLLESGRVVRVFRAAPPAEKDLL